MSTRVLVTNDDGIDAEGIRMLVVGLVEAGYDPLVVAPDADYSGAGTSLLGHGGPTLELAYERRVLAEAPDVEAYAVSAPPARCVLLALRDAFGPAPGLVASGINHGYNAGPSVRHSGTVSAALTAAGMGVKALALSAAYDFGGDGHVMRYDTATEVGMRILPLLEASDHMALSLNVPACDFQELAGIASAPLAAEAAFRSIVESRTDTTITMTYEIRDDVVEDARSDSALLAAGFATLTSLGAIESRSCVDIVGRLSEAAA